MESLLGKTITAAIAGVLFYVCWFHILPFLRQKKANLVKKSEDSLEKHGFLRHYKIFYGIIKTSLYILLVLIILLPVLFFLTVMLNK